MTITSYPIPQSHMVSYFTSNPQLTIAIRHGFVQCLEEEESTKVIYIYFFINQFSIKIGESMTFAWYFVLLIFFYYIVLIINYWSL